MTSLNDPNMHTIFKSGRYQNLLLRFCMYASSLTERLTVAQFLRIFVNPNGSNNRTMVGFKYKKSVQALNFFAQKEGGNINKMKALKLLWLSDRLHLWKHARTITDDTYFAMKLGPVASGSKDLIEGSDFIESQTEKDYTNKYLKLIDKLQYSSNGEVDDNVLSPSEYEALSTVYQEFGKMSPFELSNLSHAFPEWKKFEADINAGGVRYAMKLEDFFEAPLKDLHIFKKLSENARLAREIFIQNASISNF